MLLQDWTSVVRDGDDLATVDRFSYVDSCVMKFGGAVVQLTARIPKTRRCRLDLWR